MAIFYDDLKTPKYAQADGKMYGVRYKEFCGRNSKPFVQFRIAFDYTKTDFDITKNEYIYCTAWGNIAEIVNYLSEQNRLQVKVSGKIEESEWQGEKRENLLCTWVEPLFEIPAQPKQSKKKQKDEFDDFDI